MKRPILVIVSLLVIGTLSGAYIYVRHSGSTQVPITSMPAVPSPAKQQKTAPPNTAFDKSAHSLTDPASIWIVVNKQRPLQPKTYAPQLVTPDIKLRSNITSDERQVRPDTAAALKTMFDAAKADGVILTLESGYRSYDFQVNLYNRYVAQQGQAVADTQSARPGYSEHQTGLAVDVGGITKPSCNVEQCFGDTPEGKWVADNAYKYGFIIRYTEGKTPVTGYEAEPWHVRYVGTDLSTEMHNDNIQTLEEFFGLPPAPGY